MASRFPARLHGLLARDAPTAVVIRRGPARHVEVIGWDREHDRFRVGQWLYGRLYERRCDLPPEGRGCYFDRHQLRNARTGETVDLPAWESAEVDRGRIVRAEAGVLFAARVERLEAPY